MGYDPSKLTLSGQSIAGPKKWDYYDTGGETAAAYSAGGYFTDAKQRGVDTGDFISIFDNSAKQVWRGRFTVLQDTGASTGTVVLDTGATI